MPRTYHRELGTRKYRDYHDENLTAAVNDYKNGLSLRKCEEKHGVPFSTIQKSAKGLHKMPYGGQTVFTKEQEESLVKVIQVCGDWSCPLSTLEIRMIARRILNKEGRSVPCFKKNLPGTEWAHSFLT